MGGRRGPPWGWGPHSWGPPRSHHRRGSGLRRRLTIAFAVVAIGAVWLTAGSLTTVASRAYLELVRTYAGAAAPALPEGPASPGEGWGGWWNWDGDRSWPNWDSPAYAPAREALADMRRNAIFVSLLAAGLASLAAGVVARRLTRPLGALADGARRLAEGERGLRLRLPGGEDELRALTEAFNNLATGLERQEAWRRALVSDVAHDLRTPLAVLRSEIEAMQDGVASPDAAGLGRLHAEVMLLARLVDDLRTLSVLEEGRLPLRPEPTSLEPLLGRALGAFAPRAAGSGVTLKLLPVSPNLRATVDPDRVMQVLHNLLENTVRHGGPGEVELGAEPDGGGVRLWVRDHGPGLSKEALERAFERFYRADAARGRGGGSGLGLAIARAIAEAHGGTLTAANHPGGGAVFTLRLPGGASP